MRDDEIDRDIAAVGSIAAVPSILKVLCQMTGMGFAAVARVTEARWVACAVQDEIAFGLAPGGELELSTTLCREVRQAGAPIAIDHASQDPGYSTHPTPKSYGFESYISVPIILADDVYFGNLCAIDPRPAKVANGKTIATFQHFAHLIALELESQQLNERLLGQLLDEKRGSALREQFMAILGHDLRTPLSAIAASAYVIKAKSDDPVRVAELADRIGTNVKRMAAMVEDLLDFARGRLGGGVLVGTAIVVDLQAAIVDVIDELRIAYPDRQLVSTLEIDRSVRGDRTRIQQLVSNLIGNALVHGDVDGPVEIRATTSDGVFEVMVHNDGEPIAPESMRGLFDPFTRKSSHRGDGLGLGLYICEQIVKAHGGTLTVASTRENGTTFSARMPTT